MKRVLICACGFAFALVTLLTSSTRMDLPGFAVPVLASPSCNATTVAANKTGPTNVGAYLRGSYRVSGTTGIADCDETSTRAWFTNTTAFTCHTGTTETNPKRCRNQSTNTTSATAKLDAACGSGTMEGATEHQGYDGSAWFAVVPAAVALGTQCVPQMPDPPEPPCEINGYEGWSPDNDDWVCLSPIIISVGKDPYRLTSAAHGVLFDLDADGDLDQVAWTEASSGTAFLALDRNGNGTIDNGAELFGDKTLPNQPDGFSALHQWSLVTRGPLQPWINAQDGIFEHLLLWEDRNHNGISEKHELKKFSAKFEAISLYWQYIREFDQHGNKFAVQGWVKPKNDVNLLTVYDVFLPRVQ